MFQLSFLFFDTTDRCDLNSEKMKSRTFGRKAKGVEQAEKEDGEQEEERRDERYNKKGGLKKQIKR